MQEQKEGIRKKNSRRGERERERDDAIRNTRAHERATSETAHCNMHGST